jgi:hypothetical protein
MISTKRRTPIQSSLAPAEPLFFRPRGLRFPTLRAFFLNLFLQKLPVLLHPRRDRHLHLFIFMLMIVMVIAMAVIMMTYRCGGAGAEDLLGRIS